MRGKMGPRSIMEWIEMDLSIRKVRKLSRNAASEIWLLPKSIVLIDLHYI